MKKIVMMLIVMMLGCISLKNVMAQDVIDGVLYIPEGTTTIGDEAYRNKSNLKEVVIPPSVKNIGSKAFQSCAKLESIDIPKTVEEIGDFAFRYCRKLQAINVSAENPNYSSVDGVLFNKDKSVLICYPAGKTNLTYDVPNTVKTISQTAFAVSTQYPNTLTTVNISEGVQEIQKYAFLNSVNLTNVSLPKSLIAIGQEAFSGTNISSVTFRSNPTIGEKALPCEYLSCVMPTKLFYAVGEPFDKTGLKVFLNNTDGSRIEVNNFTLSGFESSTSGDKTIKITHSNHSQEISVHVKEQGTFVDLSVYFPPIKCQWFSYDENNVEYTGEGYYDDSRGPCAAMALGYYYRTFLRAKTLKLSKEDLENTVNQFSPKYLYMITEGHDPDYNDGLNIEKTLTALKNYGITTMKTVPYINFETITGTNPKWDEEAKQYKIDSYYQLSQTEFTKTNLKKYLLDSVPIAVSINHNEKGKSNFRAWKGDGVLDYEDLSKKERHVMVIVGFDDSKGKNGAFRLINSNTKEWGDGGYIWIDQNFMVEKFGKGGFANLAYVMYANDRVIDKLQIEPTKTGYYLNEDFDKSSLKVTAKYTNGTSEEITNYELSGFESETIGEKTIIVSYKDKTATFKVMVSNKTHTVTYYIDNQKREEVNNVAVGSEISHIDTPTKTGYTFSGWQCDYTTMPDEDIDVEGFFTPTEYEITYNLDGGSLSKNNPTEYTIESNDIVLNNPTKDGYIFLGWIGSGYSEPTMQVVISKGSIGTKSFTANWGENVVGRITITSFPSKTTYYVGEPFDDNGLSITAKYTDGTSEEVTYDELSGFDTETVGEKTITVSYKDKTTSFKITVENNIQLIAYYVDNKLFGEPQNAIVGSKINFINEPQKTGYEFSGWQCDYTTMPDENIDVEGFFTPTEYEITYNLDGGSLSKNNPTEYTIESNDITINNPTKDGYIFLGWIGSGYSEPTMQVVISKGSIGDKSFTANWEENVVERIAITSFPSKTTYYVGETFDKSGLKITAQYSDGSTEEVTDYELIGFNSDKEGKQNVTATYLGKTTTFYVNVIATPEPQIKKCKISFNLMGGTGNFPDEYVDEDDDFTIGNDWEYNLRIYKKGNFFQGWSRTPNGQTVGYIPQVTSNITLYAIWLPMQSLEITMPDKTEYFVGEELDLGGIDVYAICSDNSKVQLWRRGEELEFYNLYDVDASEFDSSEPGTKTIKVTCGGFESSFDVIVKNNTRIITYTLDGEEYKTIDNVIVGSEISLIDEPKMEGYTFSGWNCKYTTMPDENITIKGKFTINKHKITYYVDGEFYSEKANVKFGTDVTLPHYYPKGYTFNGWETEYTTMPDKDIEIHGTTTIKVYTIKYVLSSGINAANNPDTYTIEDEIVLSDPSREGYDFDGWDNQGIIELGTVGNKTIHASWTPVNYKITYILNGGKNSEFNPLSYTIRDEINLYKPTKEGYEFVGWSDNGKIERGSTGDKTFVAEWEPITYTIIFVDANNRVLQSSEVEYGQLPHYDGNTPTKQSSSKYSYKFVSWDSDIVAAKEDKTYRAIFDESVNKYPITFVYDGRVLQSSEVEYGERPIFNGTIPTKTSDAAYNYTFAGWTPAITSVTGEQTYEAQFSSAKNSYTITFFVDGETTQGEFEYGETPSFGDADPKKDPTAEFFYEFAGWSPSISKVTGKQTYKAEFTQTKRKYTITFDVDGKITENEFEYGETPSFGNTIPTRDSTDEFTFQFEGWSPTISKITDKQTYKAEFTQTKRKYTITFDVDGQKTQKEFEYGDTPSYTDPEKEETDEYTYAFAGWSPEFATVTGVQTYEAKFDSTKRKYTISYYKDGQWQESREYSVGEQITPMELPNTGEDEYYPSWEWNGQPLPETMPAKNIKAETSIKTSISEVQASNVEIWSYEKTIYVQNAKSKIHIFDLSGRRVATIKPDNSLTEIALNRQSGIYIVKTNGATTKVFVE